MVTRINKYNFLENPRIGYDQTHLAFECYWAIRLHFITEHYDFFKYQAKTTMSSRDGMNSYFDDRERTIRGTNNNWCPERTVLYRIGKHLHNPYARDSSGVFDCYSFFVYQFINGIENLHDMNTEDWECFRRNKTKDNQDHDFDKKSWIKWKDKLSIQFWKISFKRELEQIKDSLNEYEYDHATKRNVLVGHSSFNSLFEIVLETTRNVIFMTEKTWKPIIYGKPFLIFGAQFFHAKLKEIGFKLFDSVIDYEFDTEPDSEKRASMILTEMNKIKNLKYQDLLDEMKPELEHNKNVAEDLIDSIRFRKFYSSSFEELDPNSWCHVDIS